MRERMVLPFSLQLEECSFCFFKTRLFTAVFHFIAKRRFQQLPNLKIRSLLKIKEGRRSRSEAQRRNAGESRNPGKSGFARQGKMRPKKRRENSSPSLYTNLKIVYTFRIFCFMR